MICVFIIGFIELRPSPLKLSYIFLSSAASSLCWGNVAIFSTAAWVALPALTRRNIGVAARNGGHCTIDKPVGHCWLARMGQQAGIGRDARSMYIGWPDEVVGWEGIEVGSVLHHIVPDGASSSDTDDVIHDAVVAVASPDANC